MNKKSIRIFDEMDYMREPIRQYFRNCSGKDYEHLSLQELQAEESKISALAIQFAYILAMMAHGWSQRDWEEFWAERADYIFDEE